ncbi:MAG: HAD-IC family P-type ATPase [Candidatus Andersenbacteria bacterium]
MAFVEACGVHQAKLRSAWRLRDSLHFSSEWKYRATLHDHPTQGSQVLFVSGAPEVLLEKSSHTVSRDFRVIPLTSTHRATLSRSIDAHAARGERLIAMAVRRHLEQSEITHDDIVELTFLGVLLITDPIRPDIRESIAATHRAGVTVKLITGDYEATARAVARDIGLTVTTDATISGEALHNLSDEELANTIDSITVFARVNPLDKQRIIRALQKHGHVVSMTGDGVNDAVALKSADIGVAMGSGKDIAKDAADLVLIDDSFTTIVQAIREGRVIRDNVRKVIAFLLSTNVAEVIMFIVSSLAGWPLPLLPAQILWINIVTNGTSDIALALEPDERNVMQRPPEHPTASLIGRSLLLHIASSGAIMAAMSLILHWYLGIHLALDLSYVRTMIFTFVSVTALLSTWSFRSLTDSIFRRGLWQNPWISLSIGFSFLLQLLVVYLPSLQPIFDTVSLMRDDWYIILSLALLTIILIDLRKWYIKSGPAQASRRALPRVQSRRAIAPA